MTGKIYIHLVRHAQGFHNLTEINQQIPDPDLTALGKEQCAALRAGFPYQDKITHLVASPMRRTLYTCLLSFAPAVQAGRVVTALPEIQEVSNLPCDLGTAPKRLAAEFDDDAARVDLRLLTLTWADKSPGSPWYPDAAKLEARARTARRWLRDLGTKFLEENSGADVDAHIVAVTHGGFLHFLSDDFEDIVLDVGTGWNNAECRTYELKDPTGQDPDAQLSETDASRNRRKDRRTGLDETERRELRVAYGDLIKKEFGTPSVELVENVAF
ncbi:histidine phosphatase superfamily [Lasiosphaeria miniovina]|uniref:Histidine phosphatase superfamily n=1 Tax=Lasiosphaeria miniovina TaxID=1954250 RepID=A0AA40DQ85_9PEZI|nr:histidine phosphatase superfamily [Lasiosphaeria miniovina]KAK0709446.1 histidine phosphatase superfamily [Lasiosphaeria miniovina]